VFRRTLMGRFKFVSKGNLPLRPEKRH
jgi:hypothetical protein